MPSVESEAIILRSTPFGEADKMVSYFSRTHGRLRGVAPAARKSRKRFGPGLEPLTYVRLWYFERENRDLTRLEQCEVLESFWDQTADYQQTVALSHVAELSELLLPEREPHEKNFRLTLTVLRALRKGLPQDLALAYFQLWSARLAGWLTEMDRCSECGKQFAQDAECYFSPSEGRLYCEGCRRAGNRSLPPESRAAALTMLREPLDGLATQSPGTLLSLQRALLDLIEHHSERRLTTREMLHATT